MSGKADRYQYCFQVKKAVKRGIITSLPQMENYKSEQSKRLIAVQSDLNHSYLVMPRSEECTMENQLRKMHV